jgi:hypothetical protein
MERLHHAVVLGLGQNNDRAMSLTRNMELGIAIGHLVHVTGKVLTKIGI